LLSPTLIIITRGIQYQYVSTFKNYPLA